MLLHWHNTAIPALEAIENAPPEAGDLNTASRKTWERIFGGRTRASTKYRERKKAATKKVTKKRRSTKR